MDWKEDLKKKLANLGFKIEDLFSPPFALEEIIHFLKAAIEVAEDLFPEPGTGPQKSEIVMEIWDFYDAEYELIQKLLVDFKKMLGLAVGSVIEIWDSKALRYLIENLAVPQLVKLVFPNGRMKRD